MGFHVDPVADHRRGPRGRGRGHKMKCERCGTRPAGEFALFDYCAVCGCNLCISCMRAGCCGNEPGVSGMSLDADPDAAKQEEQ